MNLAQVKAKARLAVKRREELIEQEEMESGELNLVPYMDIVTNIVIVLLGSLTAGLLLGNINSALPEYADTAGALTGEPSEPTEPPVQLVVAITKNELRMFSLSGLEGTLAEPKVKVPATKPALEYDFTKLTEGALEVVKRRWPKAADRPEASFEVILMADGEIPYEAVIHTMDSLRRAKDGTVLFPDILFSTGIQ